MNNTLFLHNNGQDDGTLNMEFVRLNWRDSEALTQCFSEHCPFTGEYSRNWGDIPTNKIIVNTEFGLPRRIRTYSGMNWSARWGYGSPYLDLKIEDFMGNSPLKGTDRIYTITHFGGIYRAEYSNNLGQTMHVVTTRGEHENNLRVVTTAKFMELFPEYFKEKDNALSVPRYY